MKKERKKRKRETQITESNRSHSYIFFISTEYMLRKENTLCLLATIWLYALFWTGSPLLGWSSYKQEPFKTSCTVNWYGSSTADVTYNTLCTVFCYFVPVLIFVFCYYNVLRTTINRLVGMHATFNRSKVTAASWHLAVGLMF